MSTKIQIHSPNRTRTMQNDNIAMKTWYFRLADKLAVPAIVASGLVACVALFNLLNSF